MQQCQYLVISYVWHTILTLAKAAVCMWTVVYFGLAKFAKNANVCKNYMLGLIHQNPYDPRYMVDMPFSQNPPF